MLALGVEFGESVSIGPDICVTVLRSPSNGRPRLAIHAPRELRILRLGEINLDQVGEALAVAASPLPVQSEPKLAPLQRRILKVKERFKREQPSDQPSE